MLKSIIGVMRLIGLIEGISYLLLFGISMPLKYIWDIPEPNIIIGMAHGVLFIMYCIWVMVCLIKYKWTFKKTFLALLASLIPLGTFWADVKLFREDVEKK